MGSEATENKIEILESVNEAFAQSDYAAISQLLVDLHPAQVAHLLESLPPAERIVVWERTSAEMHGDVLLFVNDEVRSG
ncbi:MAG: magnesium transporter, partial [Gammaproteobacteria bacterium]|nr:magnesium transporter [Gammaproteobacteria bacterium]